MSFQFSYQHIVQIKEKEKDQAYSDYGVLINKKRLMTEELNSFIQYRDGILNYWEKNSEKISILDIQQQERYVNSLNRKIANAEVNLTKLEDELIAKKEIFLEKKKDEHVWHHLREKAFDTYIQKEKKAEQAMLDEMAIIRHYHQHLSH